MLRFAQERGEAGGGVESRKTAPVDRSGAMNQHRRLQIAEECVVFDSPGIAHAVTRTPRTLMRRRNIVSSRGARDLVKHIAYVRGKSRSCKLAGIRKTHVSRRFLASIGLAIWTPHEHVHFRAQSGDRARRGHLAQATCACSHRVPPLDVELQEG